MALLISILMLIGVLYFSANSFALNKAQIVTICLSAAAWLALFTSGRSDFSQPTAYFSSQNKSSKNDAESLVQAINDLIHSIKKELGVQLIAADAELSQTKSLIDDAIDDLVDSFISLEASTRIEQKLVMLLASNETENDKDELNPFKEKQLKSKQLLSEIAQKLNTLIKNIAKNDSACKTLSSLEHDAEDSVAALEKLLKKISQGNEPSLVEDVRKHTKHLHNGISAANKTLNKLQVDSKVFAEESKDISQKVNQIMNENADNIAIVAEEIAMTSAQIEKDVQIAIRSLQFQDMTTQLITQCSERQKIMQDILNTISDVKLDDNMSLLQLKEELTTLQTELQQASKVRMKQFNVDGGSVELF
jgi:methyl-accepting chemotaxis protein